MLVTEVIRTKRDGGTLSAEAIREVLADYTAGKVPDYQMAALLMAAYLRGLEGLDLQQPVASTAVEDGPLPPDADVDHHFWGPSL